MSRPDPPPHRHPAEVAGFREGVAHALAARRRSGDPDPEGESDLAEADRALARGDLVRAEALLARAEDRLDDARPETELTERPRDLVGFVAKGPPDAPAPPEEDWLQNRLRLVGRLADVRARSGADVAEALQALAAARAAIAEGDRDRARALVDRATTLVETAPPGSATPRPGPPPRDG